MIKLLYLTCAIALTGCVSQRHRDAVETMTPLDAYVRPIPTQLEGDALLVWALENQHMITP